MKRVPTYDVEMGSRVIDDAKKLTGEEKDNAKRILKIRLEDQDHFVRKSYFLCLLLFVASGIAMTVAIVQGAYHEVVLAETVMISVLGTAYMVLFVVMLCCYGSGQLRIAILLFVATFVGIVAGFMIGVNLKLVVSHLQDAKL
jgi:cbb3-type cytochrome oxidase subunit 1